MASWRASSGLAVRLKLTQAATVGAIKDVRLGHLEVPGLHQSLLDEVLHLLDVDESLAKLANAVRHGTCDLDGGRRVHLLGEEALAHGDFDLVRVPGDDLAVTADEPHGHCRFVLVRPV